MDATYLKAPKIHLKKKKILGRNQIFKNVESFEPSRSTEMSSVQKLVVPVIFFTITAVHDSLKSLREQRDR